MRLRSRTRGDYYAWHVAANLFRRIIIARLNFAGLRRERISTRAVHINYSAPGDPQLAVRVQEMLAPLKNFTGE
jgi:hypothetical protein